MNIFRNRRILSTDAHRLRRMRIENMGFMNSDEHSHLVKFEFICVNLQLIS
jgi:hypothetical protein